MPPSTFPLSHSENTVNSALFFSYHNQRLPRILIHKSCLPYHIDQISHQIVRSVVIFLSWFPYYRFISCKFLQNHTDFLSKSTTAAVGWRSILSSWDHRRTAIKKLLLWLRPSVTASRHQRNTTASHTAPKSVKSRGSIKAVNQQQTDVAGGWRCGVPGKGAPHDCSRGQST